MIITNTIDINISYRNISHYLKLGYVTFIGDILNIKVVDLPTQSHQKIQVKCEICLNESILQYDKYNININRHGFYSCKKCSRTKARITSRILYGVDNYTQLESSKEKTALNNMKKYGVKTTLLDKSTKDKIRETMIIKYGTDKFYNIRNGNNANRKEIPESPVIREKTLNPIDKYIEIYNNDYFLYRNEVRKLTKRNSTTLYSNWDGYDYYDNEYIKDYLQLNINNPLYPTIDHKISIYYAFNNKIEPSKIADISNLCITKRSINSSKRILNKYQF